MSERLVWCCKCKAKRGFTPTTEPRGLPNGKSAQQSGTCNTCQGRVSWIGKA